MKTPAEVEAFLSEAFESWPADDVIEVGIGAVARGLYRKRTQEGAGAAADAASAVSSATTSMHLDFRRLALKEPRP